MKKIFTLLLLAIVAVQLNSVSAVCTDCGYLPSDHPAVNKIRDRWRFGYNEVTQVKIGTLDETTGDIVITSIEVTCSGAGNTKCSANSSLSVPEIAELPRYNGAEALVAQGVLDEGDEDIDHGDAAGEISTTQIFTNVSNGQSYRRTFIYTWSTDTNLEVHSSLVISEPVYF